MNTGKRKSIILTVVVVIILFVGIFINQWSVVTKAHSTFENYYTFRGCEKLIERTDTYGICQTRSGDKIKIVMADGKWYLDGDLPCAGPGMSIRWFLCAI